MARILKGITKMIKVDGADKKITEDPTKSAFMVAIFIKEGKRLYIFNDKRNDPVKYPSLFAVALVESTTSESNAGILFQSKKLDNNELAPILYNVHGILDKQSELKEFKNLYKNQKLAVSPTAVSLPTEEHTHERYQELLELVMDSAKYYRMQNSQ